MLFVTTPRIYKEDETSIQMGLSDLVRGSTAMEKASDFYSSCAVVRRRNRADRSPSIRILSRSFGLLGSSTWIELVDPLQGKSNLHLI